MSICCACDEDAHINNTRYQEHRVKCYENRDRERENKRFKFSVEYISNNIWRDEDENLPLKNNSEKWHLKTKN